MSASPVFIVMADVRRQDEANRLLFKLRAQLGNAAMVIDTAADGPLKTSLRAFQLGLEINGGKASHIVVLQDDVTVCADFTDAATIALTAVDKSPVSFFANRKEAELANETGGHWIMLNNFLGGQAVSLPISLARDYLAFSDCHRVAGDHDDVMMQAFLKSRGLLMMCTVPSLVEHNGVGRSLMKHSGTNRWGPNKARIFIGEHARGAHINWNV